MDYENKKLLNEEIQMELESLRDMELGSETYKVAVDGLSKLLDKAIELEKIETDECEKSRVREQLKLDNELKLEQLKTENDLKQFQLSNEKSDRVASNRIAIAGIIIPSILTVWGTFRTLRFEEKGTVTTIMGRGFINKLLPKK